MLSVLHHLLGSNKQHAACVQAPPRGHAPPGWLNQIGRSWHKQGGGFCCCDTANLEICHTAHLEAPLLLRGSTTQTAQRTQHDQDAVAAAINSQTTPLNHHNNSHQQKQLPSSWPGFFGLLYEGTPQRTHGLPASKNQPCALGCRQGGRYTRGSISLRGAVCASHRGGWSTLLQ